MQRQRQRPDAFGKGVDSREHVGDEVPVSFRQFVDRFVDRVTILRCADFAANTLAWAGQIRATGTVRGAYPGARTSTVDERDVAAVAALALTQPHHAGQTYPLTGEQSLSQPDKVAALSAALGRPLSFAEAAPDEIRRGMLAAGLPDEVPDRLLGSLADYAREPGPTTDAVRRLLGRPARTYATWATDHRAAFTARTAFTAGGER